MTPSTPTRGRFDVWAPRPQRVRLVVDGDGGGIVEMVRGPGDWWRPADALPPRAHERDCHYAYLLDDHPDPVPDPRSRRQDRDVHQWSRTFDFDEHRWSDTDWHGRPLAGATVYELHVGTFTPEFTLDAAIERLDHLVSIGVGFVELMPVNAFNGAHGWGYDLSLIHI